MGVEYNTTSITAALNNRTVGKGVLELGMDGRSLAVASLYIAIGVLTAELVNSIVDQPYLAQQYCRGDYDSYHPKLTTPPGLYIISLLSARTLSYVKGLKTPHDNLLPPCQSVPQLRYTSLVALLILPWLIALYRQSYVSAEQQQTRASSAVQYRHIVKPTSPMEAMTIATASPAKSAQMARNSVDARDWQARLKRRQATFSIISSTLEAFPEALEVHVVAILPPLWFFGFLYYTDLPSTIAVMIMLAASKYNLHWVASAAGCVSLTLRQTNIVWALFALGAAILRKLGELGLDNGPLASSSYAHQLNSVLNLSIHETAVAVLRLALAYSPVAVMSVAFIVQNGSIVLGDKEHHQVALHWAQPLYCVAMFTIFAWPALWSALTFPAPPIRHRRWLAGSILLSLVCTAAVYGGTIAHPFLLADNRHYVFYLWCKVLNRTWWMRYALAPSYAVMIQLWWTALSRENSLFWLLGFGLCTCAAIVPSPLIEPRYFLVPYLIARLHLFPISTINRVEIGSPDELYNLSHRKQSRNRTTALALEGLWALGINAVALYLFLYKPFRWPNTSQWQRFMW